VSGHSAALPTIFTRHFETIISCYELCVASEDRIRISRYEDGAPCVKQAAALPTKSDFIADVELACSRSLAGLPKLLALWRGLYIQQRFSETKVRARLPAEFREIAQRCGKELWRRIPSVSSYFSLTTNQQTVRRAARTAALKQLDSDHKEVNSVEAQRRNARRRERYAKRKTECENLQKEKAA